MNNNKIKVTYFDLGKPYNHLGCYKDKYPNRAIPTLEGNNEVKNILTGHYKLEIGYEFID